MTTNGLIPTPFGPRIVASAGRRGESRRLLLNRWRREHDLAVAAAAVVTIRPAAARDLPALALLAELDSSPVPAGLTLLAEVDGRLRAALPLGGGVPIADPFFPSASLVRLLGVRARQLRAPRQAAPARCVAGELCSEC